MLYKIKTHVFSPQIDEFISKSVDVVNTEYIIFIVYVQQPGSDSLHSWPLVFYAKNKKIMDNAQLTKTDTSVNQTAKGAHWQWSVTAPLKDFCWKYKV